MKILVFNNGKWTSTFGLRPIPLVRICPLLVEPPPPSVRTSVMDGSYVERYACFHCKISSHLHFCEA